MKYVYLYIAWCLSIVIDDYLCVRDLHSCFVLFSSAVYSNLDCSARGLQRVSTVDSTAAMFWVFFYYYLFLFLSFFPPFKKIVARLVKSTKQPTFGTFLLQTQIRRTAKGSFSLSHCSSSSYKGREHLNPRHFKHYLLSVSPSFHFALRWTGSTNDLEVVKQSLT